MVKIFVSYARADGSEYAHEFTNRLRALRHEVFLDVQGIPGGAKWEEEFIKWANWCNVVLIIVTPRSTESSYVYNEFRQAEINQKTIVPILVNDIEPPDYLAKYNGFKFKDNNYDSTLLKLENMTFLNLSQKRKYLPKRSRQLTVTALFLLLVSVVGIGLGTYRMISQTITIDPNSLVAFTSVVDGNTDIWMMNGDRSNLNRVTQSSAIDMDPSLSPDGTQIAFASDRDGDFEIFVIGIDGQNLRQITDNMVSDGNPSWSPDGSVIAFTSFRTGNDEIFTTTLDGVQLVNVTNNPASDVAPAWSPDSQEIAFRSNRDGNSEIYIVSLDNLNTRRITNNRSQGYTVDWSPDDTLVFDNLDAANYNLYTINIDGTNIYQLTDDPSNDAEPNWSSDGQYIMFVSERVGNKELFVMRRDGSGQPVNAIHNINQDTNPDWQ